MVVQEHLFAKHSEKLFAPLGAIMECAGHIGIQQLMQGFIL